MKTKNFDRIIKELKRGKTITFYTAYKGTTIKAKHIPLLKNEREDDGGLWIGKTFFYIPALKVMLNG